MAAAMSTPSGRNRFVSWGLTWSSAFRSDRGVLLASRSARIRAWASGGWTDSMRVTRRGCCPVCSAMHSLRTSQTSSSGTFGVGRAFWIASFTSARVIACDLRICVRASPAGGVQEIPDDVIGVDAEVAGVAEDPADGAGLIAGQRRVDRGVAGQGEEARPDRRVGVVVVFPGEVV